MHPGFDDLAPGLAIQQARRLAENDQSWMDDAACKSDDSSLNHLFFDPAHYNQARRICVDCPVQSECLEWAIQTRQPEGVWGGMTLKERRNWRRKQQRDALRERREAVNA